jgi:glutathione synthase/RimK-type ligase-like ATP-grasp enzyme
LSQTIILVNSCKDFKVRNAEQRLMNFAEYVAGDDAQSNSRTRIINLCRRYGYRSEGYYCSLLAEARGQKVIPSLQTLSNLSQHSLYSIQFQDLSESMYRQLDEVYPGQSVTLRTYFGHSPDCRFDELARKMFELFPCPILDITLKRRKSWKITRLKPRSPRDLSLEQQATFADALDEFGRKVWHTQRRKKPACYDLAILCDSKEALPPSNAGALKRFIRAGRELGINCELVTPRDYLRLAEFDGLFIRATTSIDNFTFRFAKKAEREGLTVIDDSDSILRCSNKIYLADLFRKLRVPSPKTLVLYRDRPKQLVTLQAELGFPVVIKIPDGSFSRGVEKASNTHELNEICKRLFRETTLLLAQEYLYTDFDWRIGILDNKPLYACRYYMVKRHWQIYRHGNRTDSGGFDTLAIDETPPGVIQVALAATRPIGNGFYGVDVKEQDGKGYVIEVNDNPSIESRIEDRHLGMDLYREVMGTFLKRMEARRGRR